VFEKKIDIILLVRITENKIDSLIHYWRHYRKWMSNISTIKKTYQ